MRRLSLLLPLCLSPLLLSTGPSQEPVPVQDGPETVLARSMDDLNGGFKRLRRAVRRGQREEALRFVQAMEVAAVVAKGEVPPLAARLPEGERPAFVLAYRMQMCDLLYALLDLERALAEERQEDAAGLLQRIAAIRDAGHERFSPEEGD